MNELKDMYGIELTTDDLKRGAIDILTDKYIITQKKLDRTSNQYQRTEALCDIEAIKYMLSLFEVAR